MAESPADPGWSWSDAWVLTSILLRDGGAGCSLTEVVAAADAINHAILLEEEVEQAVRRLTGAGLMQVRGRRFFGTADGRRLEADQDARAGRRAGLLGRVGRLLGGLRTPPVTEQQWALEPGELAEAVAAWNDRAVH